MVLTPCSGQVLAAAYAVLLLGSMTRRGKPGEEDRRHIPSGPRPIATTPVRETSTKPSGIISATKLSILSLAPVISNTKPPGGASDPGGGEGAGARGPPQGVPPLPAPLAQGEPALDGRPRHGHVDPPVHGHEPIELVLDLLDHHGRAA